MCVIFLAEDPKNKVLIVVIIQNKHQIIFSYLKLKNFFFISQFFMNYILITNYMDIFTQIF